MLRLVASLCLWSMAAAAAELPVRRVTLSNAGLIEIERGGELAADATLSFRAPLEAIDDILKTLLLRDPLGTVTGLRLPAQDLEAEAFRGLPVRAEDFASRVALLRALRGQAVEAGGSTGRLADAEEGATGLRVTLVTEAGIRLLQLREGDAVTLRDAGLAARIARAAEALADSKSADERQLEISLTGASAAREVAVSYVAGAPVWKPSWRLLLPDADGEARLQGWAVVENHSGVDWDGITLALVSGTPAAYRQPLYTPIAAERPELPVWVADQVIVSADTGARPQAMPAPMPAPAAASDDRFARSASQNRGVRLGGPMPAAAPPPGAAEPIAAIPPALASSTAGRIAYTLPSPVTLRGGETANLPFLDTRLPAERLWWVQDLAAANPLNAVRLRNATAQLLPDGLAAVFGGGAYLGDAELRAVAPRESRILAFARDRDVSLSSADGGGEAPVKVGLQPGLVVVGTLKREETALAIDPRGKPGRLVVDLPRHPGAQPRFTVAAEGDFGLRHEAMLDGTPTTLRFVWEREGRRDISLWDSGLGDPTLLRWRDVNVEQSLRRLPGGPGTLETLAEILARLPPAAPGRVALAGLVTSLGEARRLLDAARGAVRQYAVSEAALGRARAAAEDRSGAAKEAARRELNEASLTVGRAGSAADMAWEAWAKSAQAVLARTSN